VLSTALVFGPSHQNPPGKPIEETDAQLLGGNPIEDQRGRDAATKESAGQFDVFYNYQVARFFRGGWSFYRPGMDKLVPGPLTLRAD
jgi:hypothetical protein